MLTNRKIYIGTKMLPIVATIFQIFSASFIIVSAVLIKIFFNNDKIPKPKKRNVNNFKALNIFYSLLFFLTATQPLMNLILGYDINISSFIIVLGLNAMLLSFLIMNEEARKYLKFNFKIYKLA